MTTLLTLLLFCIALDAPLAFAGGETAENSPKSAHLTSSGGEIAEISPESAHLASSGGETAEISPESAHLTSSGGETAKISPESAHLASSGGETAEISPESAHLTSSGGENAEISPESAHLTSSGGETAKISPKSAHLTSSGGETAEISPESAHLTAAPRVLTLEEAIALLCGASDITEVPEEDFERLQSLHNHPLRINLCRRGALQSAGIFTQYQVETILDYRSRNGDILSTEELAIVDGFTPSLAAALSFFVDFRQSSATPWSAAGSPSRDSSKGASRDYSQGPSRDSSKGTSRNSSKGTSRDYSQGPSQDSSKGASRDYSQGSSQDSSKGASRGSTCGTSRGPNLPIDGEVSSGISYKINEGKGSWQWQAKATVQAEGTPAGDFSISIATKSPWGDAVPLPRTGSASSTASGNNGSSTASGKSARIKAVPETLGWNVSYSDPQDISQTIIGCFNARLGQGLLLWSGTLINSYDKPSSLMKRSTGLVPYGSYSPSYALSGIAANINADRLIIRPFIDFGAYFTDISASRLSPAATSTPTATNSPSTITMTSSTSTTMTSSSTTAASPVKAPNPLKSFGGNIAWNHPHGQAGLNAVLYGDSQGYSIDFQHTVAGVVLYGEAAITIGGIGWAGYRGSSVTAATSLATGATSSVTAARSSTTAATSSTAGAASTATVPPNVRPAISLATSALVGTTFHIGPVEAGIRLSYAPSSSSSTKSTSSSSKKPSTHNATVAVSWLSDNRCHLIEGGATATFETKQLPATSTPKAFPQFSAKSVKSRITYTATPDSTWKFVTRVSTSTTSSSSATASTSAATIPTKPATSSTPATSSSGRLALPTKLDLRQDASWSNSNWRITARANFAFKNTPAALGYLEAGYRCEISLSSSRVDSAAASQTGSHKGDSPSLPQTVSSATSHSGHSSLQLSAYAMAGIFKVDTWDDRIYVYIRDTPGNFGSQAMYGRGYWLSATASAKFHKNYSLHFRVQYTDYPWARPQDTHKKASLSARLSFQFRF